jgi:SAM-dependent methyltransferase
MIKKLLKKYAFFIFSQSWTQDENEAFFSLIKKKNGSALADLGCGDGRLTLKFADKAGAAKVVGVEPGKIKRFINKKKVKIISANLNHPLPFKDNSFDIVISHFSLEHLYNVDVFIKESKRILKKGGYTLVATDNMASWPNIMSLIMGWQPFTTTYGVANKPLGNPFAVGGDFEVEEGDSIGELSHNKVLAYQMLGDAYREYGFKVRSITGVGYFPFYGALSRFFCKIDTRHAHLLIIKAYK